MSDRDRDAPAANNAGTTRLRRRSFFENSSPADTDITTSITNGNVTPPTTLSLDSIALGGDGNGSGPSGDNLNAGSSSSSGSIALAADALSANGGISPSVDGSDATSRRRRPSFGAGAPRSGWRAKLWRLHAWLRVKWQALQVHRGNRWRRASTTETLVVKQWSYATKYLKLACLSLVVLQFALFWNFQVQHFELHVEECVFQDKMLPTATLQEVLGAGTTGRRSNPDLRPGDPHTEERPEHGTTARRFLERRFEQQFAPVRLDATTNKTPRLPWTCIALAPPDEHHVAQAEALSFLLPRSQIVKAKDDGVASRMRIIVGDNVQPMERSSSDKSVWGVLMPASELRSDVFKHEFPDIVFVTTEHALQQLLLYRQTLRDAMEHRRLAATPNADDVKDSNDKQDAIDKPVDEHSDHPEATPKATEDPRVDEERARTQFAIFLLKTTVPDHYDRTIRKQWESFLHVVRHVDDTTKDVSTTTGQYTKELLTTWKEHPEWPMLHVRVPQAPKLCAVLETLVEGSDDEKATPNVDLSCTEDDNSAEAIALLQNKIGIHVFPVPVDSEVEMSRVLETLAVGAIVITPNSPVLHELVPDECGLRVGTFETTTRGSTALDNAPTSIIDTYHAQVSIRDIERAIENMLNLDRIHRVAAGRAARAHFLTLRAHYMTAVAALDAALCEVDRDDTLEPSAELGQRGRKRVDIDVLGPFLY